MLALVACTSKPEQPVIIWDGDKAISVKLPTSDSVYVEGSDYPVIGKLEDNIFTPVVPFERGLSYTTSSGLKFTIAPDFTLSAPKLSSFFPGCETVPSNLLKMYLKFSEPMAEGRSYQYIQLFDDITGDTIRNAFLDLQPELWNEEGNVLTLWIDPGRIKNDLIPNKTLGTVLENDHKYRLSVGKEWRSKKGIALGRDYTKSFTTSGRDSQKPDVTMWTIEANDTKVIIHFNEPLDWSLMHSTISIEGVQSKTFSDSCETALTLIPSPPLSKGNHCLDIESRLEDLAGNNLNRLFETDVTTPSNNRSQPKDVHTLAFQVN